MSPPWWFWALWGSGTVCLSASIVRAAPFWPFCAGALLVAFAWAVVL